MATPNDVTLELNKQKKVYETTRNMLNSVLNVPNASLHFLKAKLKSIEQHWQHVQALHQKLWTVPAYDYEVYIQMEKEITNGIIKIQENITVEETIPSADHGNNNFKLPKIELPKFNGNYLNWRDFHDLFSELVDKSPLPACQKFLYLKSSLSGKAESLIHNFATTAANYDIAWATLENRYENKRVLVNTLLRKLTSQPPTTSESVSVLKQMHDTTQECLHSLQNLGISTENWDPIGTQVEEFESRSRPFTSEELRCENHFLQHVHKHNDGKYVVKLPFRMNTNYLGDSKEIALQRFKAIERKLERNPTLRTEYNKFMKEYEELNHMQEIPIENIPKDHYILPHHAVFKSESTTTKTRVVFDASAKTSTNYSLNDILQIRRKTYRFI